MTDGAAHDALLERAEVALDAGRAEDAVRFAGEFLAKASDNPDGFCVLSHALINLERYEEALKAALQGTALAPESPQGHWLRSVAHAGLGHRRDAMKAARECVACAPDNAEALFALANAQLMNNKKRDALATAERMREIAPGAFGPHFMLGLVAIRLRRWRQGEEHLRRALEIDPESAEAMAFLSRTLEAQGKRMEAIDRLHDAARTTPQDEFVRKNLAENVRAYLGSGLAGLIVIVWIGRPGIKALGAAMGWKYAEEIATAVSLAAFAIFGVAMYLIRRKRLATLHPTVTRFHLDQQRRKRRNLKAQIAFLLTFPFGFVWTLLAVFGEGRPTTTGPIVFYAVWMALTIASTVLVVRGFLRDRDRS